jgi:phage minor structural protein
MRKAYVTIYDLQMRKVAMLENAFAIGYETPLNALWTARFSLPANDPKNAECQPLWFVEIFDGDERVDLFRILPNTARRSDDGQTITYECEHVLATLIDDVLFQYHQIGNLGVSTEDVLNYILQRQTVQRWRLGTVTFRRQFEYSWENENLLAALFSVPKPFVEEYMWKWDTSSYPWVLNLVEPPAGVQAYIRYGVNLHGIEKQTDPTDLCTRLYCLGYGEGVNQLTIAEVNDGKPYLDADTQAQYGIISRIFVDRRFTSADTLKARGEALLNELKNPRISYTVNAAELYRLTNDPIDRFQVGTQVRVIDEEMGVDVVARVVNRRRRDVMGAPSEVELEIANRPEDIAGTIADLRNRQYINDVYAQGATNLDSHDFADNCDPQHPAVLRFWVPEEAARINKVQLTYECQAFRGYSKAIEAAPATTSGPSTRETTGPSSRETSGSSSTKTTEQTTVDNITSTGMGFIEFSHNFNTDGVMSTDGQHNHGIPNGTRLQTVDGGSVTFVASGEHSHRMGYHTHYFSSEPHTHGMDHYHEMDHTHGMDHTHEIPAHSHGIEFGIFEGPTPNAVTVKVDGTMVPGLGTNEQDVDIIPYLSKDEEGRIQRGTWHTIEIAPNSLGRIVASVNTQIFIQSRGGGNY